MVGDRVHTKLTQEALVRCEFCAGFAHKINKCPSWVIWTKKFRDTDEERQLIKRVYEQIKPTGRFAIGKKRRAELDPALLGVDEEETGLSD